MLALDQATGELTAGPDIVSRGFVYVREADELIEDARAVVQSTVERCLDKNISDWGKLKSSIRDTLKGSIRDELADFIWKRTKRRPMILPIIMDV